MIRYKYEIKFKFEFGEGSLDGEVQDKNIKSAMRILFLDFSEDIRFKDAEIEQIKIERA